MKVLVVDDSHLNLVIAKRYLEQIPAITQVLLCDDSRQVKSIIDEYSIDILISDIMMPAITGIDLLAQLRADKKYDDMPIIMLTYLDDLESYKRCFELGAFDYINKPINGNELYARLKVAIESKISSNNLKALVEVTRKQNEELKEINAKLTEAKFSLVQSEKMAAIGQLAAGIAHEINNPMGFVSSNFDTLHVYFKKISEFLQFLGTQLGGDVKLHSNELIKDDVITVREKFDNLKIDLLIKELEGIFSDSSSGIQRINEIVQSLRIFARSSKDDEKDTNVLLDIINQVILITKNEVKYVATIELDVPDEIILYCNRIQIGQVFINIILNAAQAIKSQQREALGIIKIKARKVEQEIMITFDDDGPGIPEENISKIFEPFFTTKEIGQGTGLGLSISYDIIVNKHNGLFDVTSEYGKGAIFTVVLPIVAII
ncbi:MAG: ATP-binding protein [Herbinix sp.]|jgi:signal transduction histidine kinase|nr:ATP-binding protein [Herbinix sp.]